MEPELRETRDALVAGRYDHALGLAGEGYRRASSGGHFDLAVRFLGNVGMAQFGLHRFDAALQTYLQAHSLAVHHGLESAAALSTTAIALLYAQLGELEAAADWLQKSSAALTGADQTRLLPAVEIQLGTVRARQGRLKEAMALFGRAIDAAERNDDLRLSSLGWNRVGEEFLLRQDLPAAEHAFLEAYRIRKLNHLPLDTSYLNLGQLRLAQGDLVSARTVLDLNVELANRSQGAWPTWKAYYFRARVHMAAGRLAQALDDLRVALRLARAWRWSSPGDDAIRIGNEGMLQVVYSALIEAGNRLYLQTGNKALLWETLDAAEENRAASLQVLIADPATWTAEFPAAYWATLNQLQRAEVEAIRQPGAKTDAAVAALRSELVRMEAGTGPAAFPQTAGLAHRLQPRIPAGTALMAFHVAPEGSWLWALDGGGVSLYPLPPEAALAAAAERLRKSASGTAPDVNDRAAQLYQLLFGALDARYRNKARWLLALDAGLFRVPFGTLIESRGGRTAYLAEIRVLQVIPGAAILLQPGKPYDYGSGRFAGVADPIYNLADPRFSGPDRARRAGTATVPMARLVSSTAEVEACARAFGRDEPIILTGAAASRTGIAEALGRRPAVLHFATHFLQSSQQHGYALMALSLGAQGATEVVTPYEIARWRTTAGLVVLSGCTSGGGAALPGTGLLGLTRAWLAAGAHDVVASQWATPDDSGVLFQAFYRYLCAAPRDGAPAALQHAQCEMIHKGGWRSHPGYWGAYFVSGRP